MANIAILKDLRQNADFDFEEQANTNGVFQGAQREYSKVREKRRALLQ